MQRNEVSKLPNAATCTLSEHIAHEKKKYGVFRQFIGQDGWVESRRSDYCAPCMIDWWFLIRTSAFRSLSEQIRVNEFAFVASAAVFAAYESRGFGNC